MYKRFLLSHKYTGVPVDELATMLPALKNALLRYAEDVFCSYEHLAWMEQQNRTAEQNYKRCLEEQECCDAVVGFLQYPEASRGMEQELLLAKERGQPYFLLQHTIQPEPDFFSIYKEAATGNMAYSSFEVLLRQLEEQPEFFVR